jgi:hypothetical protein
MDYYRVKDLASHGRESHNQDRFSDSIKGDLLTGDRR